MALTQLGQIAMIPMLAWIANSAPANLKATYFAIMASFTNLALSFSQLGTYTIVAQICDGQPVCNTFSFTVTFANQAPVFNSNPIISLSPTIQSPATYIPLNTGPPPPSGGTH